MANSWELRLKALSNSRFLPILLNKIRRKDKYSVNTKVKVGIASFEDAFLIVILYWPTFCLFRISIDVYRENHIGKSRRYNSSSSRADRDKKVDDLSRNTGGANRRANNLGTDINTVDINRKRDNLGRSTSITDPDWVMNNQSIGIGVTDGKMDNSSMRTNIADIDKGVNNLSKNMDIMDANGGAHTPDIGTNIADKRIDSSSIGTIDPNIDRGVNR